MSRPFRLADNRAVHRAVLGLLALIVALQGLGVAMTAVRGPSHVHRDVPGRTMVLVDFRRAIGVTRSAPTLVDAWLGHRHDDSVRHRHAADDTSVVVDDASRASDAAAERAALAIEIAAAAFVAVLAAHAAWTGAGFSHARATRAEWQPSSCVRRRIERPPRFA